MDHSLTAERVTRVLDQVAEERGYPRKVRSDNGPELVGRAMTAWAEKHDVELAPIQPGKPTQNAYAERFNRTFRGEVLDVYAFGDLDEVREESTRWLYRYNHDRPHLALAGQTPASYRVRHEAERDRVAEPPVGAAPLPPASTTRTRP